MPVLRRLIIVFVVSGRGCSEKTTWIASLSEFNPAIRYNRYIPAAGVDPSAGRIAPVVRVLGYRVINYGVRYVATAIRVRSSGHIENGGGGCRGSDTPPATVG